MCAILPWITFVEINFLTPIENACSICANLGSFFYEMQGRGMLYYVFMLIRGAIDAPTVMQCSGRIITLSFKYSNRAKV